MKTPCQTAAQDPAALLSDEERQPCEVWTRVMGYHRPVSSFNRGKQGEFAERVCFTEEKAHLD
ncbi:anaerobic ribonucleoside-triphosphate reductase [Afifella pfennigii]|uniref:anaerobic ribonucleoside-triphosphate reductase n=1 Tax=Afifella pfennigii TaxID=209897 RepID=UPI00047C29EC|nr:anaerobic ribonucleoside-triphosphate reductase [Afifella pfennigii]